MKAINMLTALMLCSVPGAHAACLTGNPSDIGVVKGALVGIEHSSGCTYLLLASDFSTTLSDHDNALFAAGRFSYIALDPAIADEYKPMLAIALTAIASGTRVFARVAGRYAKATSLSMSSQENSGP